MVIFQLIQKPQKRGAELFASQLSEELKKLGHKVYLISLFEGSCDLPFSGEIVHLNRPISLRWYDVKGWQMLNKLVKKYKPDLIQCNAGDTLKWVIISKIVFNWQTLIVARNASTVSSYINSKITKKINQFLYDKADAIISVSEHSKKDLIQLFPTTKNKVSVIPIGIEDKLVNDFDWQSKSKSINIIHVGGFTFEKNHAGLIRIFESVLKFYPDAMLHLLGDGPLRKEIEMQIEEKGLSKSVLIHGWVENPNDYITKADVLVLPSIIEGLPAVILEAMYCKTPVVAYNVGGISEILNSKTGFIIPNGNELEFVDAINKSISNDCNSIINYAYELVTTNFKNKIIAQKFETEYKTIKNRLNVI